MKLNYKIKETVIAIVVVSWVASPAVGLAQQRTRPTSTEEGRVLGVCEKISEAGDKIQGMVDVHKGQVKEKQVEVRKNLIERKENVDEKREESRLEADAKRKANYDKLLEKAVTDEQKQAVLAFKQTIDLAVSTRRSKVDTAIKAYRDGIAKLASARQDSMQQYVDKFKESVRVALEKAQSDCSSGVDPLKVKSELKEALKNAKSQFEADRKSLGSMKDELEILKKTRDEAIKLAIDEYKASVNSAKLKLKEALGPVK